VAPSAVASKIDRLYALQLDEFTSSRNELARELRKAGEREEADRVKSLRKPTAAAWAVNQLARQERMNIHALLTAGERLRIAHRAVLEGKSADEVETARRAERRVIDALTNSAVKILREQGQQASESMLSAIRDTLHAAAVDSELGEQVRSGRLTREAQASGFGFELVPTTSLTATKVRGRTKADDDARERERRRNAAQKRLGEARNQLREAKERLRTSEKEAERVRRELGRAEGAVRNDEAALQRAEHAVTEAEKRLRGE
jgi:hypothetical protein